jgi:hypothetical protein
MPAHMKATRLSAPRSSRRTNVVYWTTTTLVALLMLQGGVFDAIRSPSALQVFRVLGYPDYFATLLGVAKVLGVAAMLLPVPRFLREWAYAGFTFDVVSAIVSIIASGLAGWTLLIPITALAFVQASYWSWRRREGAVGVSKRGSPMERELVAASA